MQLETNVKPWCVYILLCADGTLYTGITNDIDRRVKAHSEGQGARYTRSRRPVDLVYQESAESRSKATIREAAIKRMSRKKKVEMIEDTARSAAPSGPDIT